jgi:tetratricopeptide (TPR) repeat protein
VLLDIDIDYLLMPRVAFERWDSHSRLPWRWPEELVAGLESAGVRAELATIVYSVEGGYTPLKWKYLGDELELRLKQPEGSEDQIRALGLIREAAQAADRGDAARAERIYLEAARVLPASAAPCWRLAHLYAEAGRLEEGRQYYQRALARDPSYRTVYNSAGLWRLFEGRFDESEREHRRILALDPGDAYAHYGLGRLEARKKRWARAEASFRKSLASNPELIDAWRGLGKALAHQGRREEAIEAYSHSLRLVLAGHRPLGAPIATFPPEHRIDDPAHWDIHRRLARLYEMEGAHEEAIHGYRMAIAAGRGDFVTRSRLARLYWKRRQWRRGGEQAWQAVQRIPADLRTAVRKLDAGLRRGVRNAWRGLKSAPAR